ncbi:DUF7530 family protein [Natranaeroarchaeum sulfidigenes]|uniref:Putative membrane protein n=1 Tax=Natranaeroarchaeum sulfidigenes TaxID=2784880 RepID=A0A897MHA4_9EURY|nr:hypothetical protein [Natranaeroarchaeum sulfidigenes]QSG01530.1 putative membrane protein [Natranaeroarchaeum sulfidigenes]
MSVEYGEAWVYESIVGAIPGLDLSDRAAVTIQLVGFEFAVLLGALYYDLWYAAAFGTVAVGVAAVGSAVMLRFSQRLRALDPPEAYRTALFGSSFEVVLGLVAFLVLVTYLFVYDPRTGSLPLVERLFGPEPPLLVVFLALLIAWDVAYRIGTSWWASVVAVWRSYTFEFDEQTALAYRQLDLLNIGFAAIQLALLPFVWDRPVLAAALIGHVVATGGAVALSTALLR